MFNAYSETPESLAHRIAGYTETPIGVTERTDMLRTIFSCIDLTTLEGTDNKQRVVEFCHQALKFAHYGAKVAAICVYMPFVALSRNELFGSGINVATVSCAFPSGQIPLHLKLAETAWAVEQGADEIDMVISRGLMLEGNFDEVYNEIAAVKAACRKAHLKVILETGELKTPGLIRKASELALRAGADFLKTSTGKIQPAATPEAAVVMLDTIKEYYEKTGRMAGFKPAGGIAEPETAIVYYQLVKEILGQQWLNPTLFRIGASRLAAKVFDLIL